MKCPICNGKGGWQEVVSRELGGWWEPCPPCEGSGSISLWHRLTMLFWENVPVSFIEWYADRVMAKDL